MKISKALILYKKSAYDYYQTLDNISKKDLSTFYDTHLEHYKSLAYVESVLKEYGIQFNKRVRGRTINFKPYDVIITVGGDGTFLEASRSATNQVILGVNSDPRWSVGKFCSATASNFEEKLKTILTNNVTIAPFQRLQLSIGKRIKMNFLNDILICHRNPAAMSRYEITLGKTTEVQRSSGLWISTAVGSTGATLSAGGTALKATDTKWQYKPRELYKGNNKNYKLSGKVLKNNQMLQIKSFMNSGLIYIDGSHHSIPFKLGKIVTISKSPNSFNVVV